ncbi:MAG: GntR family transcriptional regulator [Lachnospiraceae bacterium]
MDHRNNWILNSDRPIYIQIVEIIQQSIVSGVYKPGDRVLSVREMASIANVNPNTMQKAFAELERRELIITQRTNGRTVTEDTKLIEKLKKELATEEIQSFVKKMIDLGFEKKEIEVLFESIIKEEL